MWVPAPCQLSQVAHAKALGPGRAGPLNAVESLLNAKL